MFTFQYGINSTCKAQPSKLVVKDFVKFQTSSRVVCDFNTCCLTIINAVSAQNWVTLCAY